MVAPQALRLSNFDVGTDGSTGRVLIRDASVTLLKGRRYAVVGRNGVGKTSLLRYLANHAEGAISTYYQISLITDRSAVQVAQDDETTASQYLISQHQVRMKLLEEQRSMMESGDSDPLLFAEICEHLETLGGGGDFEARAARLLHGLGVDGSVKLSELSGGWLRRLALAAALMIQPDCLLLDEPTNHLDVSATLWLESFLTTYPFVVVCVSHDYSFVDAIATDVVHVERGRLATHRGNFSEFVRRRIAELTHQQRLRDVQETRRAHLERVIARLQEIASRGADVGRAIHSRRQQLRHRLGATLDGVHWKYGLMGPRPEVLAPPRDEPFRFSFPTDVTDVPEGAGPQVTMLYRLEELQWKFDGGEKPVFAQPLSLEVHLNSRIGIIGPNGSGKSTLLKLLHAATRPKERGDMRGAQEGMLMTWSGLRCALFEQHAVIRLTTNSTPLQWIRETASVTDKEALALLTHLGVAEIADADLSRLNDGHKARVMMAGMLAERPHVLLLDEPTSHLDAESAAALTAALDDFDGAVVVASHDASFVDTAASTIVALDPRTFGPLTSTFFEYKQSLRSTAHAPVEEKRPKRIKDERKEETAPTGKTLTWACRTCGGPHFSHACPVGPAMRGEKFSPPPPAPVVRVTPEGASARGGRGRAKAPVEPASDGGASWRTVQRNSKK